MLHLNHLIYHWSRTRVYPAQSPDVNPMNINGMNWNADCTSDLFIHVPDLTNPVAQILTAILKNLVKGLSRRVELSITAMIINLESDA